MTQVLIASSPNGKPKQKELIQEAKIIKVSPAIARKWLGQQTKHQRPLNDSHVRFLANQMRAGKWMFNGESIKFGKNGDLQDGQHRLHAIIHANVTLDVMCVFGLDSEAYHTMDQHRRRTPADILAARGHEYANVKSAVAKFVIEYQMGKLSSKGSKKEYGPDIKDIINWVEATPFENHQAKQATDYNRAFKMIPATTYGAMYWLCSQIDKTDAHDFFEKLAFGLDIRGKDNIIFKLRQRLIKDHAAKERLPLREKVALISKVWNYYREGRMEVKTLMWNSVKEGWPKLK